MNPIAGDDGGEHTESDARDQEQEGGQGGGRGADQQAAGAPACPPTPTVREREFFIDNLLVRIYFIIVMSRCTGLAPREFEFPFPGSLTSTFLTRTVNRVTASERRGNSLTGFEDFYLKEKVRIWP